ncbi:hypothetical protein L6452_26172 [Arctium lappa]|uniref:Uncharacterized protein n=1 Tax=Arctium lappa TaxID=4217 RepID=A0ACB9ACI9_ARCLA|nr:hypothetical protein L6452_26172 [Arctium lappa]
MHDFCFTIPYGMIGYVMGLSALQEKAHDIVGWWRRYWIIALPCFVSRSHCLPQAKELMVQLDSRNFYALQLYKYIYVLKMDAHGSSCPAALTWVMGQRYAKTSKIMPAGVVAGIMYRMVDGDISGGPHDHGVMTGILASIPPSISLGVKRPASVFNAMLENHHDQNNVVFDNILTSSSNDNVNITTTSNILPIKKILPW